VAGHVAEWMAIAAAPRVFKQTHSPHRLQRHTQGNKKVFLYPFPQLSRPMSKVSLIGTGNVARTLGSRLILKGRPVSYGTRDTSSPKVAELKQQQQDATVRTIQEAVAWADVIILAVPGTFKKSSETVFNLSCSVRRWLCSSESTAVSATTTTVSCLLLIVQRDSAAEHLVTKCTCAVETKLANAASSVTKLCCASSTRMLRAFGLLSHILCAGSSVSSAELHHFCVTRCWPAMPFVHRVRQVCGMQLQCSSLPAG
jgi:hypothetical protein